MVDICKCDVNDKEKLASFRARKNEWTKWFSGRSRHSILQQISNLLWVDTVFRIVNEARKIHEASQSSNTGFNGPLIELFDDGFVVSQTLAIRHLTDPTFYQPNKAVFSLVRLLNDLSQNTNLFTRENYICHDGTPYSGLSEEADGNKWMHFNIKQENFDMLSGVAAINRKRNDKIKSTIISRLSKEIKVCDNIRTYVNKFVAHASAPETRQNLKEEQKNITIERLDECYQAIIRVASFVGGIVLCESSIGGVPVPQYDYLKNLNKPMLLDSDMDRLRSFWVERSKDVSKWESIDLKKYFKA